MALLEMKHSISLHRSGQRYPLPTPPAPETSWYSHGLRPTVPVFYHAQQEACATTRRKNTALPPWPEPCGPLTPVLPQKGEAAVTSAVQR